MVPAHEVQRLDSLYRIVPGDDSFRAPMPDAASFPFGCLTTAGLAQMTAVGAELRGRYARHGLDDAALEVYSTGYRRTQLSAQGVLQGLRAGSGGAEVTLRRHYAALLNSFESRPQEMMALVNEVDFSPDVQAVENTAGAALRRALARHAPPGFASTPDGRIPFRWMTAADFFWCQRSLGRDLGPDLERLAQPTIDHLCWRFSKFFTHPQLLAVMVGPLMGHLLARLAARAAALDAGYWPPYGSWVALELVRKAHASGSSGGGSRDAPSAAAATHVRILVDGAPLESALLRPSSDGVVALADLEAALRPLVKDGMAGHVVATDIPADEENPGVLR